MRPPLLLLFLFRVLLCMRTLMQVPSTLAGLVRKLMLTTMFFRKKGDTRARSGSGSFWGVATDGAYLEPWTYMQHDFSMGPSLIVPQHEDPRIGVAPNVRLVILGDVQ